MWGTRLQRDETGAAMIDAAIAMPLALMLSLGTIDAAVLLWEWNQAAKATYAGARTASVSSPVAAGISQPAYDPLLLGDACFDRATGAPALKGNGTPKCPSMASVCVPAAMPGTGSCTNGWAFDDTALSPILADMRKALPRLDRHHVQVAYETNGLGFVGRPGGLPMNVSVSIRCLTHAPPFLGPFLSWVMPANACGSSQPAGIPVPTSTTTVPAEDLVSN